MQLVFVELKRLCEVRFVVVWIACLDVEPGSTLADLFGRLNWRIWQLVSLLVQVDLNSSDRVAGSFNRLVFRLTNVVRLFLLHLFRRWIFLLAYGRTEPDM